jgi:hypothetical protein
VRRAGHDHVPERFFVVGEQGKFQSHKQGALDPLFFHHCEGAHAFDCPL